MFHFHFQIFEKGVKSYVYMFHFQIFDKGVKSYVYMLEGGPSTKMQVPRDERQGLCLTQQFVVLQLSVPLGVGFNVQILWVSLQTPLFIPLGMNMIYKFDFQFIRTNNFGLRKSILIILN